MRRGNKLKDVRKTDDAYYIPLLESLQQLLNDDSVLEEVCNSVVSLTHLVWDLFVRDMRHQSLLFQERVIYFKNTSRLVPLEKIILRNPNCQ